MVLRVRRQWSLLEAAHQAEKPRLHARHASAAPPLEEVEGHVETLEQRPPELVELLEDQRPGVQGQNGLVGPH